MSPEDGQYGVYEWFDGQLRFVSSLPSGTPVARGRAGASSEVTQRQYPGDHFISDDGGRIFFTDETSPTALYVRENASTTRPVSASERTGDDHTLARAGTFQAAKASDGSQALFTSGVPLTDDANAALGSCSVISECRQDLYLWNANGPADHRLTDLTVADDGDGGVLGVAAVSDDLSRVFFVATGDLAPGAVADSPNLYGWTPSGGVRHIAVLSDQDGAVWSVNRDDSGGRYRDARLGANGSRLLFTSYRQLSASATGGHKQVYLYDFADDRMTCVSCGSSTTPATGDAWMFYPTVLPLPASNETPRVPYRLPRNLSADGSKAFFETDQRLVPADTNGTVDVYMWSEGDLSLISSGTGAGRSEFIDASGDGSDVFFTTRDRLVGSDGDSQVDVYDARVGGGFAEQQIPAPCVGDKCQEPFASSPDLSVPGDDVAAGDPKLKPRASFSIRSLPAKARRALASGRKATLVVRVNKAGRVAARGVSKVAGRSRTVLSASRRARSAGPVRLSLRLSPPGRRQLARSGRMRVSLAVKFADAGQAQVLSLKLASASSEGKGR